MKKLRKRGITLEIKTAVIPTAFKIGSERRSDFLYLFKFHVIIKNEDVNLGYEFFFIYNKENPGNFTGV